MSFPWSPIVAGLYVLIEGSNTVPTIDIATTCRAAEKAVSALIKDAKGANFDGCMQQEKVARNTLIKDWNTYPAADKARCVNISHYMPSYVEWLTCLENAEAIRKLPHNR